jgi:DNA-binding transcriptional ArsR family regulator
MSRFEEETYSTMFTSLKHPVRRKILRMLSEKSRNFSEILEALGISSSHLTYHLESLGELVSKTDDGKYKLSTFGEAAVTTMNKVEEAPKVTEPKRLQSLPIKWKYFFVMLMIGLVVLAGVSYTQYQSLNRVSAEYEKLKELVELVEKGASLQSEYTMRYKCSIFDSGFSLEGFPWYCAIYSQYDKSILCLDLSVSTILNESQFPISVQKGNVFDLGTNETAPVIWSANATMSSIIWWREYLVPLAPKGWYTISLVGPATNTDIFTIPCINVDCSMSLRILHEGNFSPFFVISQPH